MILNNILLKWDIRYYLRAEKQDLSYEKVEDNIVDSSSGTSGGGSNGSGNNRGSSGINQEN